MEQKLNKVIDKGIAFLTDELEKNVYFGFESIFPMILVFDCLNEIDNKGSYLIKAKIKKVLLKEKNELWSFNYWKRKSIKNKIEPYPEDLDDTCLALSALYRFDKKVFKGNDLAKIINLLILAEEKIGGPYRTWILAKEKSEKWSDIDIAVNSNIGYFLKLQKIKLKNLTELIENGIIKDKIYSPFYKGELPVIYFISRFYNGKLKNILKEKLINKANTSDSALDLALIISSLIRLGYKNIKEDWVKKICTKQSKSGNWIGEDFYFYVDKLKQTNFIGTESISTAFILEALTLYINQKLKFKDPLFLEINEFKKETVFRLEKVFEKHPDKLKKEILTFIKNLASSSESEMIIATPLIVLNSIDTELKIKITKDFIVKLGQINLLGWCAYTIYDDIMDSDSSGKMIPMANIICREMESILGSLPINKETGFFNFSKFLLQKMEISNWFEQNYLCLNSSNNTIDEFDYKKLADKSLGHALSSVAILCYLKQSVRSLEVRYLMNYFRYFIVAKQMNDDVHDWLEDLEKGQINSASYGLIKFLEKNNKSIYKEIMNKENLKLIFWQNIVPDYCNKIIYFSNKAKRALNQSSLIINKLYLLNLNNKNVELCRIALKERKNTLDFIKNYYK